MYVWLGTNEGLCHIDIKKGYRGDGQLGWSAMAELLEPDIKQWGRPESASLYPHSRGKEEMGNCDYNFHSAVNWT